jgi:hypothetical protein
VGSRCDWDEWRIGQDREGFYIEDAYGEDLTPKQRFLSFTAAEDHLKEMIQQEIDNHDGPPDNPNIDTPFADNH